MSRLLIVLIAVLVAGVLLWRGSSWRQRGSRAPEPRLPSEAIDDHARVLLEPPQTVAVDSSDAGDLTSGRRSIQVVETSKVPSVAPEPRAEIVSVFVLTGRVVDDRGRGVADFRIEGKRADPSARGSGDEDLLESFRDTDGSFAVNGLVQGTWDLRATGREHAPSEFLRVGVPASGPIEIVLPREAGVSGRVVDPRGAPVVGASVQTSQKEGLPVFFSNKYSTDEQGLIEIRGLSPGSVGLLASGSGFAPSEVLSLDLAAGETVTGIVLRLRTGGTILGELVGADGRPQAGGAVSLHAQGYYISSETDVDGRFQVACVPPGEVIVWAETLEGVNLNERVTVSQGEMVHVHFAAPDGLVRLHGRVQAGGEPFAGGEVSASLVEGGTITGNYSHAEIDEDGAYQLTLTGPGPHELAILRCSPCLSWNATVDVPAVDAFEFDVTIPLGRISGRVTDSAGRGVSRNEVRAGFEQQEEKEYGSGSGETDAEGRYELLVPRGAYTVTAGGWRQEFREGSPIYAEARVPGLVVTENGHLHDVDLQLEEGGILEGIVRNADGSPAPRAMLWFEGETQEVEVMLGPSDEGGHFRFCGVTVGKHLVSGYGRTGGVREPARVEIVAGGTQRIELVLVGK